MKRLLSILAVLGLTTTIGTSVVACGNVAEKTVPDERKDLADLLIDQLELGEFKTLEEMFVKLNKVLTDNHLIDKVKVHDAYLGKVNVIANSDKLKGQVYFTYKITFSGLEPSKPVIHELDMELSQITIMGQGNVVRKIYNLDKIKSLKSEIKIKGVINENPTTIITTEIKDDALVVETTEVQDAANYQIILTADNIEMTTIDLVLLKAPAPILTDKEEYEVVIGETVNVMTTNGGINQIKHHYRVGDWKIINIQDPDWTEEGNLIYAVKGVKVGKTTLTIIADGFADKTVTITVVKNTIKVNKTESNIKVGGSDKIEIKNYDKLSNLDYQVIGKSADVKLNLNQVFEIKGLSEGVTNVVLTADDANDLVLIINVKSKGPLIDLNTIITTRILMLTNDNDDTIITGVEKSNPKLEKEIIKVKKDVGNETRSAIIIPIDSTEYTGEVIVMFQLESDSESNETKTNLPTGNILTAKKSQYNKFQIYLPKKLSYSLEYSWRGGYFNIGYHPINDNTIEFTVYPINDIDMSIKYYMMFIPTNHDYRPVLITIIVTE